VSDASDLSAIDPAPFGVVILGDGPGRTEVVVKPMKLGKLPAFARALGPISGDIETMLAEGVSAAAVIKLVDGRFGDVLEALVIASGATRELLEDSTLEQGMELLLAVLRANRDFFKGRAATVLRTAAELNSGAGPTPSKS
jgi:hypothetical protein